MRSALHHCLLLSLAHLACAVPYAYGPGFLAAGADLPSPGPVTFTQATAFCDANLECMGFTFSLPANSSQPTTPTPMYFKSAINFVPAAGWSSWTKSPPPEYPDQNHTVNGGLTLGLRAGSHTISNLLLAAPGRDWSAWRNFSWTPSVRQRALPGCHSLGDFSLRTQPLASTNATAWAYFSSAWGGGSGVPATPLPAAPPVLAADDVTALVNCTPPSLRGDTGFDTALPLRVTRSYEAARDSSGTDGAFLLRVNLTALVDTRLGGFGFSQISDELLGGDLDTIARVNSLVDPHLGGDHGYVEWVRMTGNESLLAVPASAPTRLEAWRPLLEDCNYGGWEHEWTVLSAAWAHEGEWGTQRQAPNNLRMAPDLLAMGLWGADPLTPIPAWRGGQVMNLTGMPLRYFNPPTFLELRAGESVSFALRYSLAPNGPRTAAAGLLASRHPALRSIPGYTLGTDFNSSYLIVTVPRGAPPPLNVTVTPLNTLAFVGGFVPCAPDTAGGASYRIAAQPLAPGRARAAIAFPDGTHAIAHYHITPPFNEQVASVGRHWSEQAWLPRAYPDPFGRGASVGVWDREDGVHVLDDSRAYIVGLSDDAGAGQALGFSSKVGMAPSASEVARLDEYIDNTLYGVKPGAAKAPLRSLQTRPGDPEGPDHIRMTVYYYCDALPHCTSANGHFNYSYPMQDHCAAPVGGPNWCMTENMANATYRCVFDTARGGRIFFFLWCGFPITPSIPHHTHHMHAGATTTRTPPLSG